MREIEGAEGSGGTKNSGTTQPHVLYKEQTTIEGYNGRGVEVEDPLVQVSLCSIPLRTAFCFDGWFFKQNLSFRIKTCFFELFLNFFK